jgi:hypothetical protein
MMNGLLACLHLQACGGLSEADQTNWVLWVLIHQLTNIVFLPYALQCIMQCVGPVIVQADTSFIQNQVLFNEDTGFPFREVSDQE